MIYEFDIYLYIYMYVMAFDEKPVFVLRVENKRGKSTTYAIILGVIRVATTLFNL